MIRDTMKKYKRNMIIRPEVPSLPSILTSPIEKITPVSTTKSKSRSFLKKQTHHKKNKILSDISDMYAVGLSLTK